MDPVVSVLDLEIRKILRQNFKERERERKGEYRDAERVKRVERVRPKRV